jgi:BirA family biotin operon repressor/biotin-[acetyl-CoA-carboxylase] ligase
MSGDIDRVKYVVLGIGLNVNAPASVLARRTGGVAAALSGEYGRPISRADLVRCFLAEFEKIYENYLASGFGMARDEWKSHTDIIGSPVKVNDGEEEIVGEAVDIDDDGFLLVRKETGDVRKIIVGDVVAG